MIIRFWGVHGSIPHPGPQTLKYGGNTCCVEVRCGPTIIVLDAGSGIRDLGVDLVQRGQARMDGEDKIRVHVFFSHYHWDHIQGFPFFYPAYYPENELDIYGGVSGGATVKEALCAQMSEPSFPISLEKMEATLRFHDVSSGDRLNIDDVRVHARLIRHPGGCMGYRLEYQGKVLAFASDTEPLDGLDPGLMELAQDADILIHDATFSPDQYEGKTDGMPKQNWGHSTWEVPVRMALAVNAKRVILFHHGNVDSVTEKIERQAQELFPATTAAYEGLEIEL